MRSSTIARIQRAALLLWAGGGALLAGWAWCAGGGWALTATLALLLGGHMLWLLGAQVAMGAATRRAGLLPPPWRERLRACASEARHAPAAFAWRQPLREWAVPDHLPAAAQGQRGVVLVHGYWCNRGYWAPLHARLVTRGVAVVAPSLEPPFGTIDDWVAGIDAAVARLRAHTGCAPVVVAHSMGGLAVRAWACGAGTLAWHRIVTVGSPHHGTALARLAYTPNARQLQAGNTWLAALDAADTDTRARMVCITARCDAIVYPATLAQLAGARRVAVAACGHVALGEHPLVWREVLRALRG